jgi:hypothetical protein
MPALPARDRSPGTLFRRFFCGEACCGTALRHRIPQTIPEHISQLANAPIGQVADSLIGQSTDRLFGLGYHCGRPAQSTTNADVGSNSRN